MIFDVSAMVFASYRNNMKVAIICNRRESTERKDVGFQVRILADPIPSHWLQSLAGKRAIVQLAQHN